MVIDLTSSSSHQTLARDKVSTQKTASSATAAPVKQAPAKDTLELSDTALAMKAADAKLANTPDVDSDRVAAIKAAIEEGSYQPDYQRVAERLVSFESQLG